MSDPKQARILLEAAERDFFALRGMDDDGVFADEIFGFHAQQAAEKLFKAWLSLIGETYPPTHDLVELMEILTPRRPEAARFDGLIDYTPFAVQFRYGPADAGAAPLDRDAAVRLAAALLEEVRRQLALAEDV
ncbi:MAG: HEPN domain-containing protein [Rhodospirillaceae bacterium]|nr:HEPN domain-containing protein [Rhodospirillaceae bacterium]MCY4065269.1 HEPN domain-containing protein [Rhodospirillaceae bacterium]